MTTTITWSCIVCGGPVFGSSGYLGVLAKQVIGEGPVTWHVWHDACHDDSDVVYDVGVDRLRTPEQVLDVTEHLAEKTWQQRSNWAALMLAHGIDVTPIQQPSVPLSALGVRGHAAQ